MTEEFKAKQQIAEQQLAEILRESSGLELTQLNRSATFLELGFDSLFLIQLSQRIKRRTGVKVAFRQLIEDVSTVDGLITYLTANIGDSKVGVTSDLTSVNSSPQQGDQSIEASGCADQGVQFIAAEANLVTVTSVRANTPTPIVRQPASTSHNGSANPMRPPARSRQQVESPELPKAVTLPPRQTVSDCLPAPDYSRSLPGYSSPPGTVAHIIMQQNELMMRHLDFLRGSSVQGTNGQPPATTVATMPCQASIDNEFFQSNQSQCVQVGNQPAPTPPQQLAATLPNSSSSSGESAPLAAQSKIFERFGPYKPVRRGLAGGLTEQQQRHLDQFIQRYTAKTSKSRQHAELYRAQFADPRGVAGYRRIWKSMVYQIVVQRSQGSKLWDIDGNEYIDIAMGFGLNLFGQSPSFVTEALHRQLDRGVEVGPQTPLAGEVAALLCQFSRKDRVTFCNTGSEAVMAALRLARTVTGKTKTVYFNKDYHGNFDQVLLRSPPSAESGGSAPAAPGVPDCYTENTLVLPYGTEEALRIIEQQADEIAAVLVEPVQSADPFIQPREFLHKLREITRQHHIALVMDEVISGFRAAPGGAQEWYGVWGDMATYGKVLGGGLPIGALAGSSEYMDALDGGHWRYEDNSEPDADMTFFAGTFVRHPLAIAAAFEILTKIKEEGPQLQQQLTERTTHLTTTLNRFFQEQQFPIRVAQFTSLFRMMFPPDLEYADMLYFHLLDRGIFTRGWGDNCFLSTAHSDQDVQRIIEAVQDSCLEIREAGFFPERQEASEKIQSEEKKKSFPAANSMSPSIVLAKPSIPASNPPKESGQVAERMSTVNPIQEQGNLPPLFCMPAADGLTLVYHELSQCLGNNQPVYGLDSPAIYRETIPDTLEQLAARFIEDIREIQPHGPYFLAGYCSGGTAALEVAQQLQRSGERVALLAMLETYNWLDAPSTNPSLGVQIHYQYERLKYHIYNFWLLSLSQKREFFASKLNALKRRTSVWRSTITGWFAKSKLPRDGLVNMAEIWLKHEELAEKYVPKIYPARLVHFRPTKDYRCHLGTEYQANDLVIHRMPVYPAGMMVRPFVNRLADELRQEIDRGLKECC